MFEGLRARLDQMLHEQGREGRERLSPASVRAAVAEGRSLITSLRGTLARSEQELAAEQKSLADAERRGRLAAEIPDAETVVIAERFAARHRERAALLVRKVQLQRDEVALAERELAELLADVQTVQGGAPTASAEAAWREISAAGGTRPETDLDGELQRLMEERKLHEQAAEAQLAFLKKKMGK